MCVAGIAYVWYRANSKQLQTALYSVHSNSPIVWRRLCERICFFIKISFKLQLPVFIRLKWKNEGMLAERYLQGWTVRATVDFYPAVLYLQNFTQKFLHFDRWNIFKNEIYQNNLKLYKDFVGQAPSAGDNLQLNERGVFIVENSCALTERGGGGTPSNWELGVAVLCSCICLVHSCCGVAEADKQVQQPW